jgi:hypothetical protein
MEIRTLSRRDAFRNANFVKDAETFAVRPDLEPRAGTTIGLDSLAVCSSAPSNLPPNGFCRQIVIEELLECENSKGQVHRKAHQSRMAFLNLLPVGRETG